MKGLAKKQTCEKAVFQYYIGIDCGVQTGICIWDKNEREIKLLKTVKIHVAMAIVKTLDLNNPGAILVRIEDARKRTWIPRHKSMSRELGQREGAGSVKRDAIIWEHFCTDLKIPFELIAPKNNNTKLEAAAFKGLTKYQGTTSSHARDAAMLVFGS